MTSWYTAYKSALDARDAKEKAQEHYIKAYTRLADRTALLEATSLTSPPPIPEPPSPASQAPKTARPSTPSRGKSSPSPSPAAAQDELTRLRLDLAATQRQRTLLTTQLPPLQAELSTLRSSLSASQSRITALENQKARLERQLRDRDLEILEKTRMVEHLHDDLLAAEMQVNVTEKRNEGLKRENEELVRRWMERMGVEADRMNQEGGFR